MRQRVPMRGLSRRPANAGGRVIPALTHLVRLVEMQVMWPLRAGCLARAISGPTRRANDEPKSARMGTTLVEILAECLGFELHHVSASHPLRQSLHGYVLPAAL